MENSLLLTSLARAFVSTTTVQLALGRSLMCSERKNSVVESRLILTPAEVTDSKHRKTHFFH